MPPRCFLALTVPDRVVHTLSAARDTFLAGAPDWAGEKWAASRLLHVTLAFLGPLDGDQADADIRRMRETAALVPAFELRLGTVVAVPSSRRATMLWATLDDPDGAFERLRDVLLPAFRAPRAELHRPLRPHVTLVRARKPRSVDRDALAGASARVGSGGKGPDGIVSVHSVTLFSSTLRAEGPQYRELSVAELAR
jgi:2'-5' RNA ligase